jgi:hypothetical protein
MRVYIEDLSHLGNSIEGKKPFSLADFEDLCL